jgi:phage terminase large subunit
MTQIKPTEVRSKFYPRPYQLPVLKALSNGTKRAVLCWHRRSGKDLTIFNWVIEQLVKETQICFYIFPSYSQAKKAVWDSKDNQGMAFLDYIPKEFIAQKNSQEMKIRLINGSLLQLVGSDNVSSLMGTNPKIVIFSEYALQKPDAWDFIRPILRANGGFAIFISTPRGRNHFYEMFKTAKATVGWFHQILTYKDTNFLTEEDIQQELIEGMSEELMQQEYLCSFDRGVEGAYYASLVTKMIQQERINNTIIHDPYKEVHTAWDLGWDDSTAIIFFQIVNNSIYIIDIEEHNNWTLAEYARLLKSKPYHYGYHLLPHDVENVDGLGSGCTRREILQDLGINVTPIKRALIVDGIESVKSLMSSRLHINSKCIKLINALEQYHKEYDEHRKVYSNRPVHDLHSHYCDALRYLAQGLPLIQHSTTSSDAEAKALRAYWG